MIVQYWNQKIFFENNSEEHLGGTLGLDSQSLETFRQRNHFENLALNDRLRI